MRHRTCSSVTSAARTTAWTPHGHRNLHARCVLCGRGGRWCSSELAVYAHASDAGGGWRRTGDMWRCWLVHAPLTCSSAGMGNRLRMRTALRTSGIGSSGGLKNVFRNGGPLCPFIAAAAPRLLLELGLYSCGHCCSICDQLWIGQQLCHCMHISAVRLAAVGNVTVSRTKPYAIRCG